MRGGTGGGGIADTIATETVAGKTVAGTVAAKSAVNLLATRFGRCHDYLVRLSFRQPSFRPPGNRRPVAVSSTDFSALTANDSYHLRRE
jgi:hypothetical protein